MPNRGRGASDEDSVASGSDASEGGGTKKFSQEDCKTFHTTPAGEKLMRFLRKQGDSSAAQLKIVQQYLDHVKEVEKVATTIDSEGVSDEIHISFANMTLTQLGYMKKEMLNLKWNNKSAIVLQLDGFVKDVTTLRDSKS